MPFAPTREGGRVERMIAPRSARRYTEKTGEREKMENRIGAQSPRPSPFLSVRSVRSVCNVPFLRVKAALQFSWAELQ
jgi:hypothetical protein